MVDKLPPLHQHMSDRLQRDIFVLVNYRAYESRAGKRSSGYRSPHTLNPVPVYRWQEPDKSKNPPFVEIDLSNISYASIIYISIPRVSDHLSIVDMAEPHQRCFRLLQLPSDVLYLRLAAGQSGTPLFGQLRRSGSLWLRRDRSVSVGVFGNLEGKFAAMIWREENGRGETAVHHLLSFEQRGPLENSVTVLGEHSCFLCLVVKKCHVPCRIVRIEVKACWCLRHVRRLIGRSARKLGKI